MYFLTGGCGDFLNLLFRFPILVLAISAGSVIAHASNPGLGDRYGAGATLSQVQNQIIKANPDLPTKVVELRASFDAQGDVQPTEEEVRRLLSMTSDCTDVSVKDVLSDPKKRREAAWLLYLDRLSREKVPRRSTTSIGQSPPVALRR